VRVGQENKDGVPPEEGHLPMQILSGFPFVGVRNASTVVEEWWPWREETAS
jgi:hypothetical protein